MNILFLSIYLFYVTSILVGIYQWLKKIKKLQKISLYKNKGNNHLKSRVKFMTLLLLAKWLLPKFILSEIQ